MLWKHRRVAAGVVGKLVLRDGLMEYVQGLVFRLLDYGSIQATQPVMWENAPPPTRVAYS